MTALTAAQRTAEDARRPTEDPAQTAALRRYLTMRILTLPDPAVSFGRLIEDVDPLGRWWRGAPRPGRPAGPGQPSIGHALFHLCVAEHAAGRPLLAALVGYKIGDEVGPPSDNFVIVAATWCDFEIPPGTAPAYVRNEVRRACRYWRAAFSQ